MQKVSKFWKEGFEKWRIDAVGPLPITRKVKSYILTVVDYLSRWAKATPVRRITSKDVSKFVYEEICCKFGVPLELLSLMKDQVSGLICWITFVRK